MTTADDAVIRLELPTPYPVGPVNAWWLDGPEPVLIDPGPHSEVSRAALEAQLARRGRRLEDARRILLTHDHHDHAGAAAALASRCGAPIHLHARSRLAARLPAEELNAIGAYLIRCGMPMDDLLRLGAAFRSGPRVASEPAPEVALVRHEGGGTVDSPLGPLEALATPGHSQDHLCWLAREAGMLFSGDTLLRDITPNPLLHLEAADGWRRRPSLLQYLQSLDALEALPVRVAHPGHGPDVEDVADLVRAARRFVASRQSRFLAAVAGGATTPWDLARAVFGALDPSGGFLSLSEAVGHLDLLERDGRVSVDWESEPIRVTA